MGQIMKKLITIPFSGFYNSIHDAQLDQTLEYMFSDDYGHINEGLRDRAFDCVAWKQAHIDYSKEFVYQLSQLIDIPLEFESLRSPKFYNFETDRIFAFISEESIMYMWSKIDRDKLQQLIHDRFTSCSGFISHYPNDLDRWSEDLLTWDHNELGTLLECYINDQHDDLDYLIMSKMDDKTFSIISANMTNDKANRLHAINNYLYERGRRV
jgi:hypothetical protein